MLGRDAIRLEGAKAFEGGVIAIALQGVLVVGFGITPPARWRSKKFNQLQGRLGILGVAGHTGTGDVDVGGLGEDHLQLACQGAIGRTALPVEHPGHVIGVHQAHPTLALANGTNQRSIRGEIGLGDIGCHPLHPFGGQASTAQDQLIGHQGLVIHTLAIPQAEFAFHLGIREIGIAGDLGSIHQLGIHHNHPEPAGQAIPAALGIP